MTIVTQPMPSDNLPARKADMMGFLGALPPQPVAANISLHFPMQKIATLLNAISSIMPTPDHTPTVHFVSAYAGEGSDVIALDAAIASAVQSGKRVLFIDTTADHHILTGRVLNKSVPSLNSFLVYGDSSKSPFLIVEGTSLYLASLPEAEGLGGIVAGADTLKALMDKLRQIFDLVIVYSESALTTPTAATLSGLTDGNIIVIEAERTRIPVIRELKRTLEANGGRVLGTVLNKRKFYIPRLFYPLFFKG